MTPRTSRFDPDAALALGGPDWLVARRAGAAEQPASNQFWLATGACGGDNENTKSYYEKMMAFHVEPRRLQPYKRPC